MSAIIRSCQKRAGNLHVGGLAPSPYTRIHPCQHAPLFYLAILLFTLPMSSFNTRGTFEEDARVCYSRTSRCSRPVLSAWMAAANRYMYSDHRARKVVMYESQAPSAGVGGCEPWKFPVCLFREDEVKLANKFVNMRCTQSVSRNILRWTSLLSYKMVATSRQDQD
jgi:hypothetical protein